MKKLFIMMPVFLLFLSGAASNGVEPVSIPPLPLESVPISVKVDSLTVKTAELSRLINQL